MIIIFTFAKGVVTISYLDEYILKMQNEKEDQKNEEISELDGTVFIQGRNYQFEERYLWNESFSMQLPTNCIDMEEPTISVRYPFRQRPDLILTVPDNKLDITFSFIPDGTNALSSLQHDIMQAMKEAFPSNLIYEHGTVSKEEHEIYYFTFRSFSLGGSNYNIMVLFLLGSQVVIGNMNCDFDYYEEWHPVLFSMLQSIQIPQRKGGA